MTLEGLKDRLVFIDGQIEQLIANLNLLNGSKQEILFWLSEIKTDQTKAPELNEVNNV